MAGGPAIAARKGADGHRVAVLPLPAEDKLAVLDADTGARLRAVALGVLPIASAIAPDGAIAWVTRVRRPQAQARHSQRHAVLRSRR